jgi:hypothetical protein
MTIPFASNRLKMPKTILANSGFPDVRIAWMVHLDVDEDVLDEMMDRILDELGNYPLLENISHPSDDFAVLNHDISSLVTEIHKFVAGTNGIGISGQLMEFLFALDGICQACEKSGKNIYGFAD